MSFNMRVGGLASGMDIDQIVKDLMRAERVKVDKLTQNRQILEWQQEFYREINNKLRTLRDLSFNMRLQGTYLGKKASSSNEALISASGSASAINGVYDVTVEQLAKGVFVASEGDIAEYKATLAEQFGIEAEQLKFSIANNGVTAEFEISTDKSIFELVSEINNWQNEDGVGLGIKVVYDQGLNRFFMQTTGTGKEQSITVSGDDAGFFNEHLKLTPLFDTDGSSVTLTGQDAIIDFNGSKFQFSSNTVSVAGITLNLKGEGSATVTIAQDTEAVFDAIVKFINTYNETITAISDKLYERRYKDYPPLTDEQREQLSEEQQKKWEEKARSGILRNDPLLSSILTKMRMTMSAVVSGVKGEDPIDRLSDLGIKTTADYMSGKLVIENEDKLRQAIQDDLEGVMNLFTKSSDVYEEMGIARRLYQDVNSGINALIDKAGSSNSYSQVDDSFIGKAIKNIDKDIDRWEQRLKQIENRYWTQFTLMEKYINQMNQQSMWLAMQFSGGMQ